MAYSLQIHSPQGVIRTDAMYTTKQANGEIINVTVSIRLQNSTYSAQGENTEDALLRIAKSLPSGYTLRSCLSCRHGNFCPVGNHDNEVFCTADFTPKQKSDLYFVTEDANERARRSRSLFQCCEKYMPQSEDHYTYSNYLNALKK